MLLVLFLGTFSAIADSSVSGYVKKDGAYVPPYIRS